MNAPTRRIMVRPAQTTETSRIAEVLADAFLIAPVGNWLIPDVTKRRQVYLRYFSIFAQHGLEHGIVEVADHLTGVAIWLPRDDNTPAIADYAAKLAEACGPYTPRFRILDETFDQQHPHGQFHHHLAFLAVRTSQQSRGIGSALLEHHHQLLDAEGIPAYLEASKPRNRDLYLRHDYRQTGEFWLPDCGPPLWPMWRQPLTAA